PPSRSSDDRYSKPNRLATLSKAKSGGRTSLGVPSCRMLSSISLAALVAQWERSGEPQEEARPYCPVHRPAALHAELTRMDDVAAQRHGRVASPMETSQRQQ